MQKLIRNDSGAAMLEYAMALGLLAGIFLAASIYLRRASEERANLSHRATTTTLPCETGALGAMGNRDECL